MSADWPVRVQALRLAIVLAAVFNLLALAVLVRDAPVAFSLFMFVGMAVCAAALLLLLGAILADLRSKKVL